MVIGNNSNNIYVFVQCNSNRQLVCKKSHNFLLFINDCDVIVQGESILDIHCLHTSNRNYMSVYVRYSMDTKLIT